MKKLIFFIVVIFQAAILQAQLIDHDSLKAHVNFLAHDSLEGRHAESPKSDIAADYIKKKFLEIGLKPYTFIDTASTYFQHFAYPPHIFTNVIGVVESEDPAFKHDYIVIGAHYDHIGWEESDTGKVVFNGADDNASGVAGIIEALSH
jgi:hypothetical protein